MEFSFGVFFFTGMYGAGLVSFQCIALPVREMAVKNGRKNEITSIKGVLLKWG